MNSTWLSRKIKGPNAEGDPVKKKKGVKPYQAIDMADYNKRQKMYSDSLDAHLITQRFLPPPTLLYGIVPANDPSLTGKGKHYDKYASQTKMKPSKVMVDFVYKTERMFPLYDKPKQKVILPSLEKMPIGKLKSKSTTPKKISNRKPSNFVSYDKPKKTSIANTGNPGSKTRYATVNRGDKRGTVYLTKSEYDKEMTNIFIK